MTIKLSMDLNVKKMSNKYLVNIPRSGTRSVDLMDLTTGAFDELKLDYKNVNVNSPVNGIIAKWSFATVPKGSSVYQGAVYNFKTQLLTEEMAEDYYKNYYDSRNDGAYFVSSQKVADLYGKQKDESRIIYAAMPDLENNNLTNQQEFLYPLCYIPGIKGSRVKYKTNNDLLLLDISKLENVQFLWSITKTLSEDEEKNQQEILIETLIKYEPDHAGPPTAVHRKSSEWFDPELINFFKFYAIPYVEKNYKIKLNGYIYHAVEGNTFHDEICLMDRTHLCFDSVDISPNTTYRDLPTIEEWKKRHFSSRIPNTKQRLDRVTLFSGVNNPFVGPHNKTGNNPDPQVFLSQDDTRYFKKDLSSMSKASTKYI